MGFATMGLNRALCPDNAQTSVYERLGTDDSESPSSFALLIYEDPLIQ